MRDIQSLGALGASRALRVSISCLPHNHHHYQQYVWGSLLPSWPASAAISAQEGGPRGSVGVNISHSQGNTIWRPQPRGIPLCPGPCVQTKTVKKFQGNGNTWDTYSGCYYKVKCWDVMLMLGCYKVKCSDLPRLRHYLISLKILNTIA